MRFDYKEDILGDFDETCPAAGYQSVSVCVPVEVKPFAKTGTTITKCIGNPVVKSGVGICDGIKNGTCQFTISQKLCVEVPVEFGATASVGDTFVNCIEASCKDICNDCHKAVESV